MNDMFVETNKVCINLSGKKRLGHTVHANMHQEKKVYFPLI